jgi:hypothetical protein
MNFLNQKPYGTKSSCVVGPRGGVQYIEVPCWAATKQGEQLKEARKSLELTLREAARKTGLSMGEFSRVESGQAIFADATAFGTVLRTLGVK